MFTTNPTTTGLNDFRALLRELSDYPQELDGRARREAAILVFGRRTSAQPQVSLLMQDAGALLTEVLEADLNGVAEITAAQSLLLTVSAGEEFGKPVRRMAHEGPFDPACSMAAYAMNAAEPVVSHDVPGDPRFRDQFLRRVDAISGVCVPLQASDRVFGALAVYQKRPRRFAVEEVRFTEVICHFLAGALVRASAEEERRKAQSEADSATAALRQLQARPEGALAGAGEELLEKADMGGLSGNWPGPGPFPSPIRFNPERDLRSSPRRSFRYRQKIAPVYNKAMPSKRDFVEVECRDISAGGLAFYLDAEPDFSNLIVALGIAPFESYFAARVARIVKSADGGRTRYLVGCRFTGRVHM